MGLTIKDIARMAGTSTATISRVLSGAPGVGEEKRMGILELIERCGYQPNRIAQNLVNNRSNTLGFIASDVENVFYFQFFRQIENRCKKAGYQIFLADSEQDVEKEKENIEIMLSRRVEGLIIFPVHDYRTDTNVDHLLELRLRKFPFVLAGKAPGYGFNSVTSEEVKSAYGLTKRLLDFGHRRFAFLGKVPNNRCVAERLEGVRKALWEAGVDLSEDRVLTEHVGWPEDVARMFSRKDRPTALVAANDTIALKVMPHLRRTGLSIPRDLSLVTFDDNVWSSYLQPALTTCAVDFEEVGRLTLELLLRKIEDPQSAPEQHEVPQKQVIRESCGPCPKVVRVGEGNGESGVKGVRKGGTRILEGAQQ